MMFNGPNKLCAKFHRILIKKDREQMLSDNNEVMFFFKQKPKTNAES